MGGCVLSVMARSSSGEEIPHKTICDFLQRGSLVTEVAPAEPGFSATYRMSDFTAEQHQQVSYDYYHGDVQILRAQAAVQKYGNQRCMAYRTVQKVEHEKRRDKNGKERTWEIMHLSDAVYLTYHEVWECMTSFGKGIVSMGFPAGTRVALYEETRWEWLVSCYGMWTQSLVGVTVYSNLGEDALSYALKETEVPVIVCNGKRVKELIQLFSTLGIPLPTFIYLDALPADLDLGAAKVVPWKAVLQKGKGSPLALQMPSPDDLSLIMYTSGTTGDPKGVIIPHGAITAGVLSFSNRITSLYGAYNEGETFVAFLPLAHIYELLLEGFFFIRGTPICYGSPRTLTNLFARPHGDFTEFKPMYVLGVPRIFDTVRKAVESKLPPEGSLKRQVFDHAYADRLDKLRRGIETPYWNRKVFAEARQLFGGRLMAVVVGGGPLSPETQNFINVVFGVDIMQGYGLTETCAIGTTQWKGDLSTENIGQIIAGVEMKLRDTGDWRSTPEEPCGEICIRGPFLAKGYYKQPALTAEAFVDGWMRTGDIGKLGQRGELLLVGRIKALTKNVLGEYIAMEALESIYSSNPLCTPHAVCVLVNSKRPYITALALTDEVKGMDFAKRHQLRGTWPDILQQAEFQAKAAESFAATARQANRKPFEVVKCVRVLADEWNAENGMLTAAMKLKRRAIDERYKDLIEELFEQE